MSANVFGAVHIAFQSLFPNLTAEQLNIFTGQLQATLVSSLQSMNAKIVGEMKSVNNSKAESSNVWEIGIQRATCAKARQVETEARGRKRQTNSFMAFRGKYPKSWVFNLS